MRFRTLRNWDTSGNISALLFFAQRTEELLFDYTLDTYKPTALNAPSLCEEALLVLADVEANVLDEANFEHVIAELEWAIQRDRVAKSMLEADLNRYLPKGETVTIAKKRLQLSVLAGALNPYRYFERCVEFLKNAIEDESKSDIDELARTLITTLINLGQSKEFLYRSAIEYFYYDDTQKFTTSTLGLAGFVEKIYPFSHQFDIYFIASSLIETIHNETQHFNIEKLDSLPEEIVYFATQRGFTKNIDEVFVKINDVTSFDVFSARMTAESRLSKIRDLFALFSHKFQLRWRDEALVVQLCCEEKPEIVKKHRSSMEKGFDLTPPVAAKRMNWLLRNLSLAETGSYERFDRVVELHGIGVTNNIPENQLLNLWISIETITPSSLSQNKISSVISALKPTLMLNYISGLVEQAASDLIQWDKYKAKKILKSISRTSLREATLKLLALSELEPKRKELYEALADFHLLRYRIFRISEILSRPDKVRELLDTHERKVTWQIHRIYRTRNLVVHSGQAPTFIHALIENGHNYLDQIMSQVMLASCGDYHLNQLDQVFEFAKIRYERYERLLANTENFDDSNVLFLLGNKAFSSPFVSH